MDPFEDSTAVPGPEHTPAGEIRQVDFARRPVGEPEPDSQPSRALTSSARIIPLAPWNIAVDPKHFTASMT